MKKIRRQVTLLILALTLAFIVCGAGSAADEPANDTENGTVVDPPLEITKGSWDTAGLDSNNVNVGPNQTIIQFRVKNPDPINTAHDVTANFAWTSTNTYINLAPGETAVKNIGDILPGETKDVFYLVEITRNSGAYFTSRNYQVTIQGSDTPLYTPTGSIYVEKLLSQNRNDVTGIYISPSMPHVGETFTVTVTSTTGSANYPELALPLVSYDPSILKPLGMVTTYTDTNNIIRSTNNVYIPNPQGNAFTTVWTFMFTSAGMTKLYPVIYDRSGSSYHYNADYGETETAVVPANVGNWVWYDANANGMQDPGELGVPNVLVTLYNSTGSQLETRVTDANGYYYFNDVYPGDYYLKFTLPAGYSFSPFYGPGYDNKANPNPGPNLGETAIFNLSPGEDDYTWDAGILGPELYYATIGDYVWDDQNADGINQGRGMGIPGVTVNLYLEGGTTPINSTTTNAGGFYYFDNLIPTQDVQNGLRYFLEFILPAGYNFSPYIPGFTDNKADPTPGSNLGRTPLITLGIGQTDLTWDAGMYRNVTIGDFVWDDQNANGIYDGIGPGINGVTVNLYVPGGLLPIRSTTTSGNGNYLFDNLVPGDYIVEFIRPSVDWIFSPYIPGVTNNTADPSTGRTATITLYSGQIQLQWDAGMYRQAVLGDYV